MSANRLRGRGVLASALSAAADWLVEPADASGNGSGGYPAPLEARPVVAVVGLSARCGATTVARALGAQLAARDPGGACAVTSTTLSGRAPLGLPAAARLARELAPVADGRARACGRLCLVLEGTDRVGLAAAVRYLAPLVIDVHIRADAPGAAAIADHVVMVGSPSTEPSLAAVLGQSLSQVGPRPVAVLNRAGVDEERWAGRAELELPESLMGARVVLAGREPRGALGRAVGELAERCRRVS